MLTRSICPACYQEIPAEISVGKVVQMDKTCPKHGAFTSVVEREPRWFELCRRLGCQKIYDGYLIDVTDRCNLKCKYCFHANGAEDRLAASIVAEAKENARLGPIIFSGGEPTLHPELPKIIRALEGAERWILTNGIRLNDEAYFEELCDAGLLYKGIFLAGLSLHPEAEGKDLKFLELCRRKKIRLGTAFVVIDDITQLDAAVTFAKANRDVLSSVRIKAASNLWSTQNTTNRIYVSDMLKRLWLLGPTRLLPGGNQKISYAETLHAEMPTMLISWYDRFNVDLKDIDCPPYTRAKDGSVGNLVTSWLRNEALHANL